MRGIIIWYRQENWEQKVYAIMILNGNEDHRKDRLPYSQFNYSFRNSAEDAKNLVEHYKKLGYKIITELEDY